MQMVYLGQNILKFKSETPERRRLARKCELEVIVDNSQNLPIFAILIHKRNRQSQIKSLTAVWPKNEAGAISETYCCDYLQFFAGLLIEFDAHKSLVVWFLLIFYLGLFHIHCNGSWFALNLNNIKNYEINARSCNSTSGGRFTVIRAALWIKFELHFGGFSWFSYFAISYFCFCSTV